MASRLGLDGEACETTSPLEVGLRVHLLASPTASLAAAEVLREAAGINGTYVLPTGAFSCPPTAVGASRVGQALVMRVVDPDAATDMVAEVDAIACGTVAEALGLASPVVTVADEMQAGVPVVDVDSAPIKALATARTIVASCLLLGLAGTSVAT